MSSDSNPQKKSREDSSPFPWLNRIPGYHYYDTPDGDTSDDLVKRKVKIVQNPESSDSDDSEQEYGERFEIERNDLNLQDLVPQKDWVVVKYDNDYYPGEVQCVEQNEAKVKVMHCSKSGAYYFWPTDEDCIMYKAKDIVKKIEPPEPYGGTRDHYKFKSIIGPLPDQGGTLNTFSHVLLLGI